MGYKLKEVIEPLGNYIQDDLLKQYLDCNNEMEKKALYNELVICCNSFNGLMKLYYNSPIPHQFDPDNLIKVYGKK